MKADSHCRVLEARKKEMMEGEGEEKGEQGRPGRNRTMKKEAPVIIIRDSQLMQIRSAEGSSDDKRANTEMGRAGGQL